MLRRVFLSACLWLCAVPVIAQSPQSVQAGIPALVVADHDGQNTQGYRLRDNGTVIAQVLTGALANGMIQFPYTPAPGPHSVTVAAFNLTGEATSAPLLIQAVATGCPDYLDPEGMPTPHVIGDVLTGWNQFELTTVAGMNRYTARIQQLTKWGFAVVIDQPATVIAGAQYVHLQATCVGVGQ